MSRDAGHATAALVLLVCIFGAIAFLFAVRTGEGFMCKVTADPKPAYCAPAAEAK